MMVPIVRCRNREECVLSGRDLLAADVPTWSLNLIFGDRVGAVRHSFRKGTGRAEDLAVVLGSDANNPAPLGPPDTAVLPTRGWLAAVHSIFFSSAARRCRAGAVREDESATKAKRKKRRKT